MATRSTIAVVHESGEISQIYCHWDGYLSGVGGLLLDHYNTLSRAEALINLGDISVLKPLLYPETEGHSFETPHSNVTIAYGRDRGELGCEARTFWDETIYRLTAEFEEYNYLFKDGVWYRTSKKGKFTVLTSENCS